MMRILGRHRALSLTLALLGLLLAACAALLAGNNYWHARPHPDDQDLLTISNALSPSNLLPRTYFERIKAAPMVAGVTEYSSVALFLSNERQIFTGVIVDKEQIATTLPRMGADAAMLARWQRRKDAILVSATLLAAQHLAIGDMVAARLFSSDGESNHFFYIAGTFGTDNELRCTGCVILGRDFADFALPSYRGVVGSFHVRLRKPADQPEARRVLDAMFSEETPATHSASFLPAASALLNDLIDLRDLVFHAVWLTLAAALLLPALCANLLALTYRSSLAMLLVFGHRKIPLSIHYLGWALAAAALVSFGGALLAWLAGSYLFENVFWLRMESPYAALQGALGAGILVALSAWTAVASVIAKLTVDDLFRDTVD